MVRFSAASMVGFAFLFQTSLSGAQSTQIAAYHPANNVAGGPGAVAANISALPAPPPGPATVMGGVIHAIDPVRDQFELKVFGGGHPVKILFDARTQLYLDGTRVSMSDLRPDDHASVETTLDGNNIYALRIHMLSTLPEGNCQGQVLDYNPSTGILTLNANLSRQPIKLKVPSNATIERLGQSTFASAKSGTFDLTSGALVSVKFRAGSNGHGIADHISILATPGSDFAFSGSIASLDIRSGRLTLVNSTDGNTYEVFVNPTELREENLHEGQKVRVTARFDGTRYVAGNVTSE